MISEGTFLTSGDLVGLEIKIPIAAMKLQEFQQYLNEKKIGLALFIHPDIIITYFTQLKPSYAYLVITPTTAAFYFTALDKKPALKGLAVRPLSKNWSKAYKRVHKIGINNRSLTVAQLERLKKIWPKATFVDVSLPLEQLRRQKTKEEVEKIQKACQITSTAFAALLRELPRRRLKTELDVVCFLEEQFRQQQAEPSFPTIVAMGRNAAIPHHIPDNTRLTKGFLVVDFGAKFQNYCADMTRTVYVGKPSSSERKLYFLLQQAQEDAIRAVEEGTSFTVLDKVARKRLGRYSSSFIHSLGHGIGLEVHEAPTFSDKKMKVQEQAVFTIEPGIYLPGKLGIRIEDTVVFDGKVKVLTSSPKELICL